MRRVLAYFALVVAGACASAAALVVWPAPIKTLALLAILAGERSLVVAVASLLAGALALMATRPGLRIVPALAILLSLGALVVAMTPAAQAYRLANERHIDLDLDRYVRAEIDTEGPVAAALVRTFATLPGDKELQMDVYLPLHVAGQAPARAIVNLHGGGWSAGDKGDNSLFSHWLATQGFAVFDVGYRIAPQPNAKAAVGDVKCAVGWLKAHATTAEWTIDPERITLLGRSAGGHLALIAAYTERDSQLPASCSVSDTRVDSVIAFYAPTDLTWGFAHPGKAAVYDGRTKIVGLLGGDPTTVGDLYRRLSPIDRVQPGLPRTLLIHGGRDQFVSIENSERLDSQLRKASVESETLFIPYAQHSFDFVFGGFSEQIAEATILRFLNGPRH